MMTSSSCCSSSIIMYISLSAVCDAVSCRPGQHTYAYCCFAANQETEGFSDQVQALALRLLAVPLRGLLNW